MKAHPIEDIRIARRRAWIRLQLGTIQITGATMALMLLVQSGINRFSLGAVVLTGCVSVLSRLLFPSRTRR
jgi:hypothetical protein